MDLNAILVELRLERERVAQAITALERLSEAGSTARGRSLKPVQPAEEEAQVRSAAGSGTSSA